MSPFPSLHSLNRHLWARIPHTLHCAANARPDDANRRSIRIRGFEFGIKMSRSKLPFECLQWSTTHTHIHTGKHTHQPSHSLCYALMRQEHEGCMCITNVIPSHQMVQVFTAKDFFLPPSSSSLSLFSLSSYTSCSLLTPFFFSSNYTWLHLSFSPLPVVLPQFPFFSASLLSFTLSLLPIMCS